MRHGRDIVSWQHCIMGARCVKPPDFARELVPDGALLFCSNALLGSFHLFSFGLDMCYIIVYTIFKQGSISNEKSYSIHELSNDTETVLSFVAAEHLAVITENGKPSALMIGVSEENFEETLSILKQMKDMHKNQRENEKVGS